MARRSVGSDTLDSVRTLEAADSDTGLGEDLDDSAKPITGPGPLNTRAGTGATQRTTGSTHWTRKAAHLNIPNASVAVNCKMGQWTGWGACDKSCGKGNQTRTRAVLKAEANGGICADSRSEVQECTAVPCPADCEVGDWGEWQPCSKVCGSGLQTRERPVTKMANDYGKGCPNVKEERSCNTQACAEPPPPPAPSVV